MAAKNSVKIYIENTFYHLYNRGVNKQDIFLDEQDYSVFLSYLKNYLLPKDKHQLLAKLNSPKSTTQQKNQALKELRINNFNRKIELHSYALLPNHFHLLIKNNELVMNSFMNSLGTRYAMYFNKKYKRTGVLFQDVYKAVPVDTDEQLLQLSFYIHLNPIKYLKLQIDQWEEITLPFSLAEYLGKRQTEWLQTSYILSYFSKSNPKLDYASSLGILHDLAPIAKITLDYD